MSFDQHARQMPQVAIALRVARQGRCHRETFGDIKHLLTSQGFSRGDVIRFLRDIQSGAMSMEEANHFLEDCREWEAVKHTTSLSREEFFTAKLAARKK